MVRISTAETVLLEITTDKNTSSGYQPLLLENTTVRNTTSGYHPVKKK